MSTEKILEHMDKLFDESPLSEAEWRLYQKAMSEPPITESDAFKAAMKCVTEKNCELYRRLS